MFNLRSYYKNRNEEIAGSYEKSLEKIKEIYKQTKDCGGDCKKKEFSLYFNKILDVLPVLIIEKMGPHFAIGDTCFTMSEDKPVFNNDGKEITARDNEKTIKRKTDPQEACTFCHTDITLPYESLGHITAVTADGEEIDIIRDERFVLKGSEDLNIPFKK